jgi:hypothetical protein
MAESAQDRLDREREAMRLKLGLSPSMATAIGYLVDEFINIEKTQGPIAFYKKQRELFGDDIPQRRNDVTGCCPNCNHPLTIRIERA